MKKSLAGLLIATWGLIAPAVVAQEAPPAMQKAGQTPPNVAISGDRIDPDSQAVVALLDRGPGDIDIPVDRRADLGGCGGADGSGLLQAIHTCWPVLQTYRILAPLQGAVARWEALPRARQTLDTAESRAIVAIADAVIADIGARTYPAQDPPLLVAHLTKGLVAIAQDDLGGFVAHYSSARDLIASSPIKAHWFTRDLRRIDSQVTGARDLMLKRGQQAKAKAAVPSD